MASNLIPESAQLQYQEELCFRDPFDSHFATLCLNGFNSSPNATVDSSGHHPRPCCRQESCLPTAIPMKRRSSTSSYVLQDPNSSSHREPKPKKLFLDQEVNLTGFSKIDLPISLSSFAPPLRRTVSDPSFDYLIDTGNLNQSPDNVNSSVPSSLTPSTSKRLSTNSALPPLPPTPLRRTISDPNPSPEKISKSPSTVEKVNNALIKEDSPDSKKLRRLTDRMKEMSQWWTEVIREQEHEESKEMEKNGKEALQKKRGEEEIEETVGAERIGDSLELHLKCPCGKGFDILLSGTSCFYKLV